MELVDNFDLESKTSGVGVRAPSRLPNLLVPSEWGSTPLTDTIEALTRIL